MDIDRYDLESNDYGESYMSHCAEGDWVPFAAYQDLENDYNILRRDYQKLVDKIGELYREA